MGFFSDIISTVATVAGALVPGPLGAVAQAIATVPQITAAQQTTAFAAGVATGTPTGAMRKQTLVQTLDKDGKVVKQTVTKGGVAVFQQDVTAANRVARQLRRLDKRMPKKLVRQSETARLNEEVKQAVLRAARDRADCPPKC